MCKFFSMALLCWSSSWVVLWSSLLNISSLQLWYCSMGPASGGLDFSGSSCSILALDWALLFACNGIFVSLSGSLSLMERSLRCVLECVVSVFEGWWHYKPHKQQVKMVPTSQAAQYILGISKEYPLIRTLSISLEYPRDIPGINPFGFRRNINNGISLWYPRDIPFCLAKISIPMINLIWLWFDRLPKISISDKFYINKQKCNFF